MATIGTFKKVGDDYHGEIFTLAFQAKGVRITSSPSTNPDAPSHRVFVGRADIGGAWPKTAEKSGRDYHSLRLDDPSFPAPIYANLVADAENEGAYILIWSRPTAKNGD